MIQNCDEIVGEVFILVFYISIIQIKSIKTGHVGELKGCHGDTENQLWTS